MKELTDFIRDHFKDRQYEMICLNGYRDHLHVMVKPALNESISKVVKEIKGATSNWLNKSGKVNGRFSWQRGFGAFSVSPHDVGKIIRYILIQQRHHERGGIPGGSINSTPGYPGSSL